MPEYNWINSEKLIEEYFTPDSRWLSLWGADTFDRFSEEVIPNHKFIKAVPNDIVEAFILVKKIVAASYFYFPLYDEAVNKATRTFEMALKMKYSETFSENSASVKINFHKLIQILHGLNLFDSSEYHLQQIRKVRNYLTHKDRNTFAPTALYQWMNLVIGAINELFSDKEKRVERQTIYENINKRITPFQSTLSILERNDKRVLIKELKLIFIDNFEHEKTYHFWCMPLYNLEPWINRTHQDVELLTLHLTNIRVENTEILAHEKGSPIRIILNDNPLNDNTHEKWEATFQTLEEKEIFDYLLNWQIEKFTFDLKNNYYQAIANYEYG